MRNIKIISINLQEGLITNETNNQIYAVYSHHNKVVFVLVPYRIGKDFQLPKAYEDYHVIQGFTDCIGLQLWRPIGNVSLYEGKQEYMDSLKA